MLSPAQTAPASLPLSWRCFMTVLEILSAPSLAITRFIAAAAHAMSVSSGLYTHSSTRKNTAEKIFSAVSARSPARKSHTLTLLSALPVRSPT